MNRAGANLARRLICDLARDGNEQITHEKHRNLYDSDGPAREAG